MIADCKDGLIAYLVNHSFLFVCLPLFYLLENNKVFSVISCHTHESNLLVLPIPMIFVCVCIFSSLFQLCDLVA
jgi:hypothetical protein